MRDDRRLTKAYRDWTVYAAAFRPGLSKKRVVEIHDAMGNVIVQWGGFDSSDYSYTQQVKNARLIVKAVNDYKPKGAK